MSYFTALIRLEVLWTPRASLWVKCSFSIHEAAVEALTNNILYYSILSGSLPRSQLPQLWLVSSCGFNNVSIRLCILYQVCAYACSKYINCIEAFVNNNIHIILLRDGWIWSAVTCISSKVLLYHPLLLLTFHSLNNSLHFY